jgi:hypothetical protein
MDRRGFISALAAVIAAPFAPYKSIGLDIYTATNPHWQIQRPITFKGIPVFVDDTLPANVWYLWNERVFAADFHSEWNDTGRIEATIHLDTTPLA